MLQAYCQAVEQQEEPGKTKPAVISKLCDTVTATKVIIAIAPIGQHTLSHMLVDTTLNTHH